jgi:hypothetical protein
VGRGQALEGVSSMPLSLPTTVARLPRDVPSSAMDPDDQLLVFARRELVLIAVVLVTMGRFVPSDAAFLVAGMLPVVMLLAGLGVAGSSRPGNRPLEALLVPATLTGGSAAAIHLVPVGLGLIPALVAFAAFLDRVLALEMRLATQLSGASRSDRSRVLLVAVVTAFITFTGIAALVPGGMAEPVGATGAAGDSLTPAWLLTLVIDDALVGLVLGYRVAVFRYGTTLTAVRSAVTYAIVIAVAAGAIRAVGLPRLVGPALLTLVFYLWDALHGTAPARRREPRFLWETLLLVALGVVVVLWNQRVPG